MKLRSFFLYVLLICVPIVMSSAQVTIPKREFRGAWIQTVNGQFQGMSTRQMQKTLIEQLNSLQGAGINAIMFQVRPEADAFYKSSYEPWSRFLTGVQGVPPSPFWDPLQFMIDECHKRNMELHAWINPYRAKTKGTVALAANHPYKLNPDRFFQYQGLILFDPGLPENRQYICKVVKDILMHYDVDGIHIDDYFYPYPENGVPIPDDASFAAYGAGFRDRGNWRRNNVNQLIFDLHNTIRNTKPWVKFGVSPFGIYRNKKNDPHGSDTNGLQNYDDLYADVMLWVDKGWVDYLIPQIYWEIGNPVADYDTLVRWWALHAHNRPLFIGQDVARTAKAPDRQNPQVNQIVAKLSLQRSFPTIQGSCQWPAIEVVNNTGGYRDILCRYYHKYPALMPLFPFIDNKAPGKVRKLKNFWTEDGLVMIWFPPKFKKEMDEACKYVVYRFAKGEKVNLNDASKILIITDNTYLKLPYKNGKSKFTYVVTALDRLQNESKAKKCKVKL